MSIERQKEDQFKKIEKKDRQKEVFLEIVERTADVHFFSQESRFETANYNPMLYQSAVVAEIAALLQAEEVGLTDEQIEEAQRIGLGRGLRKKRENCLKSN